jgi:hypothetical protein
MHLHFGFRTAYSLSEFALQYGIALLQVLALV